MYISRECFPEEIEQHVRLVELAADRWRNHRKRGGSPSDRLIKKLWRRALYAVAPNTILGCDITYIAAISATVAPCGDMALHAVWALRDESTRKIVGLPKQTEGILTEAHLVANALTRNPFKSKFLEQAETKQRVLNEAYGLLKSA